MTESESVLVWANNMLQDAYTFESEVVREPEPAVFIVGAPRSGTTLLHQLLVSRLRVGYIDNLVARFWGCPTVGIALSKELISEEERISIELSSDLGRTTGIAGPHEFGYFWSSWFRMREDLSDKLSKQRRAAVDINELGRSLQAMQRSFQLPLVFKNLTCGLQAQLVRSAYPNALFLYVERNPIEVGRSILAARKRFHGNYQTWLSLRPGGWPEDIPDGGAAAEVAWQVKETVRQVKKGISNIESISVHYEDILSEPEVIIQRIADRIRDMGGSVRERGAPLAPLEHMTSSNVPENLLNELRENLIS